MASPLTGTRQEHSTPDDPGAQTDRGRRWRPHRQDVVAGAAVLAVMLLTAVAWLTRPGGDVQGAATQAVAVTGISGPIESGTVLTQEVVATEDDLKGFAATFGTYRGVTDCAVRVTVADETGDVLSDRDVACADMVDTTGATEVASFAPIPDSEGRTYTVTYSLAAGDWSEAVTLWVGEPQGAAVPATAVSDDPVVREVFEDGDTATATIAEYVGPSTWEQFGLATERLGVGAPWWSQPAAMVVWSVLLVAGIVTTVVSRHRWRVATAALVVVAIARGLVWASVLPPLEGMDEGAHVSYAEFLAQTGSIPVRHEFYDDLPNQYSEQLSVLDRFQNRDGQAPGDRASHQPQDVAALEEALEDASPAANGDSPSAGYPPAYYLPAAVLYELTPGTLLDKIYAMRLWSVALGALTAWATMAAARRLLPGSRLAAALLAVAVTVQPMMAHQFAIVNNDALAILGGIAALAVALRLAEPAPRFRHAVLAGGFIGLALLAKPYGIGMAPVAGVALAIGAVRTGFLVRGDRAARIRHGLRSFGAGCAGGLAGLAATYGIWFVIQQVRGIPTTSLPNYPDGDPDRGGWRYVELQLMDGAESMRWRWGEQLFGSFAWLDVKLPGPAYGAVWWGLRIMAVLVVAWVLWQVVELVRRRWTPQPAPSEQGDRPVAGPVPTWLAVVCVAGVMATLYAAGYLYFRYSGRDELLQGRYALMALPAVLALPALTIDGLLSRARGRWRRAVPVAVVAGVATAMWVLHVIGLATIADRFYL